MLVIAQVSIKCLRSVGVVVCAVAIIKQINFLLWVLLHLSSAHLHVLRIVIYPCAVSFSGVPELWRGTRFTQRQKKK